MKINPKGFWENETSIGHCHDNNLLKKLIEFVHENKITNMIDFGCGDGFYMSFIKNHVNYFEAYDGNPFTRELTKGIGEIMDFTEKVELNKKFDLVISLEVGEHIPEEFEGVFIDNITNHANNFLILSWAVKNQIGDGHINCQNNDYIIREIEKRNFIYLEKKTIELRKSELELDWFKNTIMIFQKNK